MLKCTQTFLRLTLLSTLFSAFLAGNLEAQPPVPVDGFCTVLSAAPNPFTGSDQLSVAFRWGNQGQPSGGLVGAALQVTVLSPEMVPDLTASTPGFVCTGRECRLPAGPPPSPMAGGDVRDATLVLTPTTPLPADFTGIEVTCEMLRDLIASGQDVDATNDTDALGVPFGGGPALGVSKVADVATVEPGDRIEYTIVVANDGDQDAANVAVTETVPQGTRFLDSGSTPGWSCADASPGGTACVFDQASLAGNGSTAVLTFGVRVLDPQPSLTTIDNTVTVRGATASTTTPIVIPVGPDIAVAKTAPATVQAGDQVVFTLVPTLISGGSATGVVLTETVPSGTVFAAAVSNAGWSCANGAPAGAVCTLLLGNLDSTATGDSVLFGVDVIAPAGSIITNTATIEDGGASGPDPNPLNNTASTTTQVVPLAAGPDVAVTKTAPATVESGEQLLFTITPELVTGTIASGVVLTETVPAGSVFAAEISDGGWSCADGAPAGSTCTLFFGTLGGLAVGQSVLFGVEVIAQPGSIISNTVTVADDGSQGADPNLANNAHTTTTHVIDDGPGGLTAIGLALRVEQTVGTPESFQTLLILRLQNPGTEALERSRSRWISLHRSATPHLPVLSCYASMACHPGLPTTPTTVATTSPCYCPAWCSSH